MTVIYADETMTVGQLIFALSGLLEKGLDFNAPVVTQGCDCDGGVLAVVRKRYTEAELEDDPEPQLDHVYLSRHKED